jgi:2'-hydroxyisoflavone reductase
MKLLVLGGTRFLGRHLVEAALARAMDVTIFTRGRGAVPWLDRVTSLVGDRDPRIAPGLDALAGRRFDAVVDCSGNSSRRATSRLGCSTCSSATSPARSTRRAPHGNGE